MAFRISIGDYSDVYLIQLNKTEVTHFTWIVWGAAVDILSLIFMNFLIAVIGGTYQKVMQKV